MYAGKLSLKHLLKNCFAIAHDNVEKIACKPLFICVHDSRRTKSTSWRFPHSAKSTSKRVKIL